MKPPRSLRSLTPGGLMHLGGGPAMHELGITRNVVAICAERANGAQVLRVTLEIGKRARVMADSVTTTNTAIPTINCSAIAAVCS